MIKLSEFIFGCALFINALLFIPQALSLWRTKNAKNISLITFIGFLLIQAATVLHGIIKHDAILVIGYLFSMVTCGMVTVLTIRYRNRDVLSFQEILDQLPGHIYWKDKNGVCLGANRDNWSNFGCESLEHFVGKSDYDLFPAEEAKRLRLADAEVMRTGTLKIVEEIVTKADGTKALYLSYKVPLKNKDAIVGILGVSVDITKEKQEILDHIDMLENVIALMPGHVYWLNKDNIYQGCNDNQAYSIGLSSRKDIIGKSNRDIAGFLIAEVLDPVNEEVISTGKTIVAEEPAILLDGTKAIFLSTKAPLYNRNKEIIGMVGISMDITDRKRIIELTKLKEQAEKIRLITAQVAHDINSPLAALRMLMRSIQNVDEDTRIMIRNTTSSIADIANTLVIKYGASGEVKDDAVSSELIASLVSSVLSEKRIQYSEQDIAFELNVADNAQGLFANVNPELCKRALSNIINNAVEAITRASSRHGKIVVSVVQEGEFIDIRILDNGCGIPSSILEKLGVVQVSSKAEGGHGLGLSTAIQLFKSWQGSYVIDTQENIGTTFTVRLPIALAPKWFTEKLQVVPDTTIVVLDDDQPIHDVWNMRFRDYEVLLKHFSSAEAMLEQSPMEAVFLIDYELLNSKLSGIDVIRELKARGLGEYVFLVTSRYEDEKLRAASAELAFTIIPKNYAPYIPIEVARLQPDYIFIDDNVNLLRAWQLDAAMKNKHVAVFSSIQAFEEQKHLYSKTIPIYIDYVLGSDDGVTYSKQLAHEGFKNLYLATGYDQGTFTEPMPWLQGIVGKEAPNTEVES